jgi:peptide deformylase
MASNKKRRHYKSLEHLEIVPVDKIPTSTSSPPTEKALLYRACQELQEVCDKHNGVGLSAVQVGLPWRLFVIRFKKHYEYFVNCRYKAVGSDTCISVEGCLSIKTPSGEMRFFEVERFKEVQITGHQLTDDGELIEIDRTVDGFYGTVFQHEIDHQLQILISDIGKEIHVYPK